jgi:hypothetical protein
MKCFAQACTPTDCIPRIVSYALTLVKNGSAPNPSQIRPAWGTRPMFITGPNAMFTPFPRCSCPIATPRARISERLHLYLSKGQLEVSQNIIKTYVAAALMPAGKTVVKSVPYTPSGESERHRPGKSSTGGVFPAQRPTAVPTPVVTLTFCSSVKLAIFNPSVS